MLEFAKGVAANVILGRIQIGKIKREKRRTKGRLIGNSGRSFQGLTEDGWLEWRDAA